MTTPADGAYNKYMAARWWRKNRSENVPHLLQPLGSTTEDHSSSPAEAVAPDSPQCLHRKNMLAHSISLGNLMAKQRSVSQLSLVEHQRSILDDNSFQRTDSIETMGESFNAYIPPRPSFNSERLSEMSYGHTDDSLSEDTSPSVGDSLQISGFLLKKDKDGAWQRRFFETQGTFLTYYKSKKKSKLLAALNLAEVDDISVDGEVNDLLGTGVIFQLDLKDKRYLLRAKSAHQVRDWIHVLRKIKASIHPGAVKAPIVIGAPKQNIISQKPPSASSPKTPSSSSENEQRSCCVIC